MITPKQIRAARALVGWQQTDLAQAAGMSLTGLSNIEKGYADPKASTLVAIESALRAAGVEFVDDNERIGVTVKRG
ncbi:helix-turn-helix domain-containing protein [Mesorhizobium loti]|uniref:helix-turn-helix domain-containing protein n=1 Tax=Rhizobium loti TaxID=381 RepID=UPI00047B2B84|nr:helix-turn-helix transcriptional regulator [Mesorhizobium loti]